MSQATLSPVPRIQFFDSNGVPLAGGLIYTYAAGTTTPLATYTDATGSVAATNPIVLDAGGFASIWLGASSYKIVAQNSLGVTQWTVDNVADLALELATGVSPFAALSVTGNLTVGGNETIGGTLGVTGASTLGTVSTAALTASSESVTGNLSVGGTLGVTGATTLTGAVQLPAAASVNVGSQTISALISSLIPPLSALPGNLVLSYVSTVAVTGGYFVVFQFGTTVGTRVVVAFGVGSMTTAGNISLPSGYGFTSSNALATAAMTNCNAISGYLEAARVQISSLAVSFSGLDSSGNTPSIYAGWTCLCWAFNY